MDSADIYMVIKLLQYLVEKNCTSPNCRDCYQFCDDCPLSMIKELMKRNNIT